MYLWKYHFGRISTKNNRLFQNASQFCTMRIKLLPKLPIPVLMERKMENDFDSKKQKSYTVMRMTYDLTMALLFLAMAAVMLLGEKLKIQQFADVDPVFRYFFGGICLLYGGFRLYRGIKREY